MKKVKIAVIFMLILSFFCGCSKSNNTYAEEQLFLSDESLMSHLSTRFWVNTMDEENEYNCEVVIFKDDICTFYDFSYTDESPLEQKMVLFLTELSQSRSLNAYPTLFSILNELPIVQSIPVAQYRVSYDAESNEIRGIENDFIWTITSDSSIRNNGSSYWADQSLPDILDYAFDDALKIMEVNRNEAFLNNFPGIVSYTEVLYDPYRYLDKNFYITGSVKLDDFYNWEYSNMENSHFCLHITPEGKSSYTDNWYIYASRTQFSSLFNELKNNGSCKITLICKAEYERASAHNSATLVGYKIL